MTVPVKLGGYVLALLVVFGVSFAVGGAFEASDPVRGPSPDAREEHP